MSERQRISGQRQPFAAGGNQPFHITDGEINFLWSFIQGSIAIAETWNGLMRSYGFCARHAWIHMSVELSFRDQYLLGPTILYAELIDKSVRAISASRTTGLQPMIRRLRAAGPCLLCALNVKDASAGACPQARLDRGRDTGPLRNFAGKLEPLWRSSLCPGCAGASGEGISANRCRQHLLAAMQARIPIDISAQKDMLRDLSDRVGRYQKSFLAGGGEAADQDRAALITAIGWCSGWQPLLAQLS